MSNVARTVRTCHVAVVDSRPEWGTWPWHPSHDFSQVMAKSEVQTAVRDGVEYEFVSHYVPIHAAYRATGFAAMPPGHPYINNLLEPPPAVLDAQAAMLLEASRQCDTLRWWGAIQCFEPVARRLPRMFPRRILHFNDDCPGVSELKSFPVAQHFNVMLHGMYTWSFDRGERVADLYRARGVERCYFCPTGPIRGLGAELMSYCFDVREKAKLIADGVFPDVDLAFVGYGGGIPWRTQLIHDLANAPPGVNVRLHGVGAPHGALLPRSDDRLDWGPPVARLYMRSLFGVNPQQSSLFNERLQDMWRCGVAQLVYDPHGELAANGFRPNEHYIPFDGSAAGLYRQIEAWKAQPKRLAGLIINAATRVRQFAHETSLHNMMARICAEG